MNLKLTVEVLEAKGPYRLRRGERLQQTRHALRNARGTVFRIDRHGQVLLCGALDVYFRAAISVEADLELARPCSDIS
jgi:hypothetical protein